MLPLVLAGAAAIFLTGCYAVFPSQQDLLKNNLRRPKDRGESEDGMATQVYHQLKDEGVSDSEMDRGCQVVDFDRPGPNANRVGKKDGEIWPCETYSHAIENYETYRDIVEGIAQGPVPWTLNDRDAATTFDKDLRDRIHQVRDLVRDRLAMETNTSAYQEKLALALFFLTLFPKDQATIQDNRDYLSTFSAELQAEGMGFFREYLFKSGGLGVLTWDTEFAAERSALEAYAINRGKCTERSKLLFAVLREAGCDPFFVRTDYLQMKRQIVGRADVPVYLEIPFFSRWKGSHVYIGVRLPGARPRYLDPMFGFTRPNYLQYYPLDLTHALALDLSNRGVYQYEAGANMKARSLIRQSFRLSPQDPLVGQNYDMILLEEGLKTFL
jgi:hypothetical protein